MSQDNMEIAINLLRAAKEQGAETYLKGCVNYILKMKPKDLEVRNAKD